MDNLAKLFSFTEESKRLEYFGICVLAFFIGQVANYYLKIRTVADITNLSSINLVLYGLLSILITWLSLAVAARRFNDLGMSPWNVLWLFVPIVNLYFGLVLLFKSGY